MNKTWYVYIITNYTNKVFYTGVTNNLKRRLYEHKKGKDTHSFSQKYHLYKLVWTESFPSPEEAIVTEKKIKGWGRKKKIDLIITNNPNFQDITTQN